MRSIFLIFESELTDDISAFLDTYCVLNTNCDHPIKQWIVFGNNDPCLYIDNRPLSETDLSFDDTGIPPIYVSMKNPVVWAVDISGRHDGTAEVMELVRALFAEFTVYLMDDYTNHFWTPQEIIEGNMIEGHHFFDYCGWYEENI